MNRFQLLLNLLFGNSVFDGYFASQLIQFAFRNVNIIVCQLAPLFLHFSLEDLPVALELFGVHVLPFESDEFRAANSDW